MGCLMVELQRPLVELGGPQPYPLVLLRLLYLLYLLVNPQRPLADLGGRQPYPLVLLRLLYPLVNLLHPLADLNGPRLVPR